MHEKFCVVDNVHTICGSYNWTLNAENKNDEDATFHLEDYKFASKYSKRFNEIWKRRDVIDENELQYIDLPSIFSVVQYSIFD